MAYSDNTIEFLHNYDPEVADNIKLELSRMRNGIELIASENVVSNAVLSAVGSILTNKYAEGYPNKRYYGGCVNIDAIENIAIERAKKLFGCEHVNVQPHSGAQANIAVYFALLNPGDTVLGMSLNAGGHLTHGSKVNLSGKYFNFASYGVSEETGTIDYDNVLEIAKECKPKLIVAGASAYPRTIDFKKFREIADEVGALFMVDMAHIAGLVATGYHPSPVPYADIVTTTTHKTLRGPRGGIIMCKEEYAKAIDKAIFPGTQGGPLEHVIAGKAVCFGEALKPEFKEYAHQIILNAKALEVSLKNEGFDLVSGGTDNHLILTDLRSLNVTGKDLEERLDSVNITCNKNSIPNDPQKPTITSGVRLGTPAATSRGFKEKEFTEVGHLIGLVAKDYDNSKDYVKAQVSELCSKFELYKD